MDGGKNFLEVSESTLKFQNLIVCTTEFLSIFYILTLRNLEHRCFNGRVKVVFAHR